MKSKPNRSSTASHSTGKAHQFKTISGCIALALALTPFSAMAGKFSLDNGFEGVWSLNTSLGTSIRTSDPDAALIMMGNGGTGGSSHDDGNLNFEKGDAFSIVAKVIGELNVQRDGFGVFLRTKAWYDHALENSNVAHGHSANGFQPNSRLNDSDFDSLSKFSGIELLDAYVFGQFGDEHPLSVNLGSHAVNWGESLFIPGINQYGAFDVSASRRPGSQVKEVVLPIPQMSFNLGVSDNISLEGFYQLRWRKSILDGCGTYWSISDVYNCSDEGVVIPAGPLGNLSDSEVFNGLNNPLGPFPAGITGVMKNAGNIEPSDSGQWGLASRFFVPALSTEFGLYWVNYHQRTPTISILLDSSPNTAFASGANRMQYTWDWSAEDISVVGASFSTSLAGWSLFGEVSHTKDLPTQLNGLDLLRGASAGAGPLGFIAALPRDQGLLFTGYDLLDKTQAQVSTLKFFPRVMGAESLQILGELAYQKWGSIGDPMNSRRYGRAFVYGQAMTDTLSCANTGNFVADYCEAQGFATSSSWGYRAQATWSYPGLFGPVNAKPRVFWSHDVSGYSGDATFVEDRKTLSVGLALDFKNKYYADISYNRFNSNAKYDTFRDRDFVSMVVGVNF